MENLLDTNQNPKVYDDDGTKRAQVISLLENKPYYSYRIIGALCDYNYYNVAALARVNGLKRTYSQILSRCKKDMKGMMLKSGELDYVALHRTYGLSKEEFDKIFLSIPKKSVRPENRRARVEKLLRNTNLTFSIIATIVGTNLYYVSKIAKSINVSRSSRNPSPEYGIKALLSNLKDASYLEICEIIPRASIDDVIAVAKKENDIRAVTSVDENIIIDFHDGIPLLKIGIAHNLDEYVVESVLILNGLLKEDSGKDKEILDYLVKKPSASFTRAAKAVGTSIHFAEATGTKEGIYRPLRAYKCADRLKIIKEVYEHPELTYASIAERLMKSSQLVWCVAKENGIARYEPREE